MFAPILSPNLNREVRRSLTWHSSESESALKRFEHVVVAKQLPDGRGTLFAPVAARRQKKLKEGLTHMRSMCVGVAETGVKAFLFLSFSFFSDKRKELYKKSIFRYLAGDHWSPAKPTKQKNGWLAIRFLLKTQLFNDKILESRENLIAVVGMNRKSDRIEQVKAENTHDRLCIYNISATGKVDFLIELADNLYKISYCFYRRKTDFYRFHNNISLL